MKKTKLLLILFALFAFGQTAWAQTNVNYIDADGELQTASAYLVMSSDDGASWGMSNYEIWYYVQGNVVINGQVEYNSNVNLILCDGASLTVNTTDESAIQSQTGNNQLTIYVQSQGTGQLVATATSSDNDYNEYKAIQTENLTIHGGVISATGGAHGIYAPNSDIIINGGTVTAVADGNAIEGYNITINGGIVSATGNGGIKNGMTGQTILGYTNNTDRITATNYLLGNNASSVYIKDDQYMITNDGVVVYGWLNEDKRNAIAGRTLRPFTPTEWAGHGESDDPYIIDSEDDLILLSLRTGGGSEDYTGKYFRLDADLNFTASTNWDNITSPESNFSAISIFDGHFNGNSHTISGLRLHTSNNFVEQKGLFNNLGPNAYIESLTISNARIAGEKQVGAIVGNAQEGATITNCHVTNTVTVYAYGNTLQKHGGVVGNNEGTVSNCVSEVTISRSIYYAYGSENVGGIAGYNTGSLLDNKVFNANITAGSHYGAIAGNSNGTLTNNYYRACTINGTANVTNKGCDGEDVTANDGALSLHTIAVPNTVTIVTSPTLTYNAVNYWAQSKPVTLSGGLDGQPEPGCQKAYYINSVALQENSTTIKNNFDMPATDVTITIGEIHADWANTPNNPTAGSSSDNPYKIYFTDQMNLLATRVNNGTSTYNGKYFQLMDDLTYDNTEQNNYTAIGTGSNPFKGHFNGNQKTINGIRINTTGGYLGVFGYIVDAEVQNLYVNDIVITGNDHVGCIVGECNGSTITNCRVTTATLNATDVYPNCSYFGGIAGCNLGTSTMSNNFVLGVDIPYVYQLGAIASLNQGLVSNYYHNCTMGGTAYPTGIGCSTGDITTNDGALPVFTVSVPDGVTASDNATVTHNSVNYYKKDVTVTLSGGLDGTPGEGLQKAYVVYGETLIGSNLAPSHEFRMQNANAVVTIGSMPADWAAEEGAGDTEENPYKIYYKEQLDLLATRVNAGNYYSGKYFKLMNNLTYSYAGLAETASNYTPIGVAAVFKGHFDGNGKTISGIRIYLPNDSYRGLFGRINENAEVKNLTLTDAVITAKNQVGGIVGTMDGGTVTNCCVTSSVTIRAVVNQAEYHGGIVGEIYNSGSTISHCTSSATLTIENSATDCSAYGAIVGYIHANAAVEDNFAIGATVPETTKMNDYSHGAIVGEIGVNYTLERNYYLGCKVGSENVTPSGVGCGGSNVDPYDIIENDGAVPVFTLSVASGITAEATVTLTHNEVDYYKLGTSVSLSYVTPAAPGYRHIYSVNGLPIEGNIFYMDDDAEVTVALNQLIDWAESSGNENDPYLIYNDAQWNLFATRVNGGTTYSGKFFKLMENISVTTMVGSHPDQNTYNSFNGTFDGDGHTLNLNISCADNFCGPFRFTYGATIKNLITTGTITTTNQHAGGVVGRNGTGNLTLTNVKSSVVIDTRYSGDAQHGGLVGYTINADITGCAFTGRLLGGTSTGCSGLIGWKTNTSSSRANITDCIFAPAYVTVDAANAYTLARNSSGGVVNVTNCYYTETLGTAQGKLAHSITGGENVTVEFAGDVTTYNVSEITTNGTGIKYGDMLYAGNGDNVNLTLGAALGYSITGNFSVNEGTLTSQENYYTLSMPGQNVTISATTTRMGKHFVTAGNWDTHTNWADNDYPTSTSDEVFVFAAATIPGTCCAQAGRITIASEGSITIEDGGQLFHNKENVVVTMQKNVAAYDLEHTGLGATDGWYFIAIPFSESYIPDATMLSNTYDLYRLNNTNTTWENFKNTSEHPDFTSLENGWGYLYANSAETTLQFVGPLKPYSEIEAANQVDVSAGWNLIGNPFPCNVYADKPFYKMNEARTGLSARLPISTTVIRPCEGIIVNAEMDGTVTFTQNAPTPPVTSNQGSLQIIAMAQVNNERGVSTSSVQDNAIVSFNEGITLPKFRFGNNAEIYIPQNGKDYAIAYSDRAGEMPVNFKAKENGQYTITVKPEGVEMAYLHLIDNLTGANVDLLDTPSYTFEGKTTDYASRFKLLFVANNAQIGAEGSEDFAFISNGQLIVTGITDNSVLQIIDITGRVLSSCNASNHISTDGLTAGVYVLRLIDGENVRTQKIVVK